MGLRHYFSASLHRVPHVSLSGEGAGHARTLPPAAPVEADGRPSAAREKRCAPRVTAGCRKAPVHPAHIYIGP
ncbi:hypothetical protein [uncultured Methanofollis sp.]|uniref:hypothetical protein n=1 Tax=uncultured Methanofollis sp. TaxID=262500 RepID=UPI002604D851|nr:hypothetical protein [uncultured Methanofollis sp.]